jgi:hypothetical protein
MVDGKRRKEKSFFFSTFSEVFGFWPKVLDLDFPQKVFCGVFELPLLRNAPKRHKKNLTIKKKK